MAPGGGSSVLAAAALRVARSRLGGSVAWLALGPLRRFVPIRIEAATKNVTAFRHPRPAYPRHFLIVPTRRIRDLRAAPCELVESVLDVAHQLGRTCFDDNAVELVTNLGAYQDVALLHFHVIDARARDGAEVAGDDLGALLDASRARANALLQDAGRCRVVIAPATPATPVRIWVQ